MTSKRPSRRKAVTHRKPAQNSTQGTVQVGTSLIHAGHLQALQSAWRNRRLVIFLGAGVSSDYGVPTWRDLVLDLLLESSRGFKNFWREYRTPLASWMTEYHGFELTTLARVIKQELSAKRDGFPQRIQEMLYRKWNAVDSRAKKTDSCRQTAVAELARIIFKSQSQGAVGGCDGIVNFNFDDFLEFELDQVHASYHHVCESRSDMEQGVPILHPHGYLPQGEKFPQTDLVFAEDEYHRLSLAMFHWAVTELLSYLRHNTCLFIGLSMSDPNLRRLLDATKSPSVSPHRFVLRRELQLPAENEIAQISAAIESSAASLRIKSGKTEHLKNPKDIYAAMEHVTSEANRYQTSLFQDMGAEVMNIQTYGDIPAVLRKIAE